MFKKQGNKEIFGPKTEEVIGKHSVITQKEAYPNSQSRKMILVISGKGNKLWETKSHVKRPPLRPWHR